MKTSTRHLLLLGLLSVVLASCKAGGAASRYVSLDDSAQALRDQFNKDVGQVRVVMLVAPS